MHGNVIKTRRQYDLDLSMIKVPISRTMAQKKCRLGILLRMLIGYLVSKSKRYLLFLCKYLLFLGEPHIYVC